MQATTSRTRIKRLGATYGTGKDAFDGLSSRRRFARARFGVFEGEEGLTHRVGVGDGRVVHKGHAAETPGLVERE